MNTAIETPSPETTLPLLADPGHYAACTWDLTTEPEKRNYWIDLFRHHFPRLLEEAVSEAEDLGQDGDEVRQRGEAAKAELYGYLDEVSVQPDRYGKLDILELCWQRERALRRHGFVDPYRLAKQRENEASLKLLPPLLEELDGMSPQDQREATVKGVFAGNIFDLGASRTIDMFRGQQVDFHATRQKLKPRPWFIDHQDDWLERLNGEPHRAAILFVDNAGPDVVLGMVPLARLLLKRGTRVILTANSEASLNDVTHAELVDLIDQVAAFDGPIAEAKESGQLQMIPSGNGAPLVDLSRLSPELVEAARREPVDLVMIEGMGRAMESNFYAELTCEVLKVAMIKDQGVADSFGAALFDLMFKYERGG